MADSAPAPGWYPDPWKQSPLRWHDGAEWTGHVHDTAAPAVAELPHLMAVTPLESSATDSARVHLPHLPTASSYSGLAITALVTALIAIPLAPLILGILAVRQIGRSAGSLQGRWIAIVGIVLGSFQLLLIIAFVLAVAVPTFLVQKDVGLGTLQAKASVKHVASSVESCSAANRDGTYRGCGAEGVTSDDPGLGHLLARCGSPGGVCIELSPNLDSYRVTAMSTASPPTSYVGEHTSTGELLKTCSGPACPSGRWN